MEGNLEMERSSVYKAHAIHVGHGKLLMNGERTKYGLTINPSCITCEWVKESLSHVW